jgi:hypothetical protein
MSEETKTERTSDGKFAKGNRGGPGNPFTRRVAQLRCLLMAKMTDEALSDIADKLLELARKGDLAAIKLALQYAVGLPQRAADPDGLDADELRRLREERVPVAEVMPLVNDAPTAWEVNAYARAFNPERRTWLTRNVEKEKAERAEAAAAPTAPEPDDDWEAIVAEELRRQAAPAVPPLPLPDQSPLPLPQQVLNVSLDDIVRRFAADCKRAKDEAEARPDAKPKRRKSATR